MSDPIPASLHRAKRYVIFVDHPVRGWIPVGRSYPTVKDARAWLSFVKSAWHRLPCRVVHFASLISPSPRSQASPSAALGGGAS